MMTFEYKVIAMDDVTKFPQAIADAFKEGYTLQGGISMARVDNIITFAQALVRVKKI